MNELRVDFVIQKNVLNKRNIVSCEQLWETNAWQKSTGGEYR